MAISKKLQETIKQTLELSGELLEQAGILRQKVDLIEGIVQFHSDEFIEQHITFEEKSVSECLNILLEKVREQKWYLTLFWP